MLLRRIGPRSAWQTPAFGDLDQVRRDMYRLLGALSTEDSPGAGAAGVFPPVNITQDDDRFYVRAELPGIRTDDLSISTDRNRVSISGKREIPDEKDRVSYHRREREDGMFNRTVSLPGPFDSESVEARYSDGILTIALPKAEEAKPRRITVKSS